MNLSSGDNKAPDNNSLPFSRIDFASSVVTKKCNNEKREREMELHTTPTLFGIRNNSNKKFHNHVFCSSNEKTVCHVLDNTRLIVISLKDTNLQDAQFSCQKIQCFACERNNEEKVKVLHEISVHRDVCMNYLSREMTLVIFAIKHWSFTWNQNTSATCRRTSDRS